VLTGLPLRGTAGSPLRPGRPPPLALAENGRSPPRAADIIEFAASHVGHAAASAPAYGLAAAVDLGVPSPGSGRRLLLLDLAGRRHERLLEARRHGLIRRLARFRVVTV